MRAICSVSPAGFFSWPPGDSPLSPAQVKLLTRILLWTGFTGAVLLILVEGLMWVFFPAPKRISQEFEFENQLPGLKEKASFTLDERLLRTWKPDDASTGKEIHIVCLGGMATSAVLQNAPDTWWGRLASELQRQYPKSAFRVSALSVEAGGILYGARWAQQHLPSIKPQVVIAMYGFDDIMLQPGDYVYDPKKIDKIPIEGRRRGPLKEFLLGVSQICRRISNSRQRFAMAERMRSQREINYYARHIRQQQSIHPQLPVKYEIKREPGHDPVIEYLDGLKWLAEACQKSGAALCVAGEPTLNTGLMGGVEERLVHRKWHFDPAQQHKGIVRVDPGGIELELNRYQREAEKFCRQNGVPFINLHRNVAPSRDNFVDDVILTDAGAAAAARILVPVIKPLVETKQ
jgi:hypothetical protein